MTTDDQRREHHTATLLALDTSRALILGDPQHAARVLEANISHWPWLLMAACGLVAALAERAAGGDKGEAIELLHRVAAQMAFHDRPERDGLDEP
jgi:hypothetical protein